MGWGTYLTTDIYFDRKTYSTIQEVEADIEETKEMIQYCRDGLKKLAYCTEPSKMMSEEDKKESSPDWWIQEQFNTYWESIGEYYTELYKLECLHDKWKDCHDEKGKPIKRELSVSVVPGDSNRCWDGLSEEALKEKFKKCDNYLPFALIDGDFIFSTDNDS